MLDRMIAARTGLLLDYSVFGGGTMSKSKDMRGQRFTRLFVTERHASTHDGRTQWTCRCDCGNTVVVPGHHLRNGNTRSCGCLKSDLTSAMMRKRKTTHGKSKTGAYNTWFLMISRCMDPENHKYPIYGARGITVCERWMKFENFYEDMGDKSRGLTIERIDNMGNYEKDNCKWGTPKEQANNTRRNRRLTFQGETLTLTDWAKRLGINPSSLYERLTKYSPEVALSRSKQQPGRSLC